MTPEAVEVGARVERLALRLLGTHVVRRAAQHAGARAAVAGQQAARETEVDEHHAAVVAQHDVRRLEVAMDDAGLVHHLERARDFLEEGDGLVGGQRILQPRLEVAAGKIFHREVFDALVDAVVEQVDDRRMIERGDGLELALEHDGALAGVGRRRVPECLRLEIFSATLWPRSSAIARYTAAASDSPIFCRMV